MVTTINVHQIKKIEIMKKTYTSNKSHVLRIALYDTSGHSTDVTVFSDKELHIECSPVVVVEDH